MQLLSSCQTLMHHVHVSDQQCQTLLMEHIRELLSKPNNATFNVTLNDAGMPQCTWEGMQELLTEKLIPFY